MREGWIEVELGAVSNIQNGKNQKHVIQSEGKFPIYGSSGIIGRANDYLCVEGTTIIGRKGTINNPIYVKEKFWNVDTAFGITPKRSLINKYLFFFCQFFNFHSLDKSTTIPSLAKRDLLKISFPLPPLPEQRAIVAKIEQLFSELDHGVAQLKKAQAQLKVYKQAVLKKAFEGDWEEYNINEVSENFDGKRKPLSRKFRETFKGNYPYYGACDVIDYVKEYLFDGEYLLIGEDGANLVSKNKPLSFIAEGKFWVNNHAHVLKPNKNMNIKFLMYQFNALDISEFISGSAQPKLSQRNLNRIQLKICDLQQQTQIVQEIESRFSVCDAVEKDLESNLQKAESLRQSILKQAFEGKLLTEAEIESCKKEKDWEPAESLLERIEKETK